MLNLWKLLFGKTFDEVIEKRLLKPPKITFEPMTKEDRKRAKIFEKLLNWEYRKDRALYKAEDNWYFNLYKGKK